MLSLMIKPAPRIQTWLIRKTQMNFDFRATIDWCKERQDLKLEYSELITNPNIPPTGLFLLLQTV